MSGSVKQEWGGKSYFLALCIDILKTVRDTTKVTTNDLGPRSMTLDDDLELL